MTAADELRFRHDRVTELLEVLARMAAGDVDERLPTSPHHDELDAIAYAVNILVGELSWSSGHALAEQKRKAEELREAVAEADRANAAKSVFLRNVSHEIRTPIAAMLGFADLLASSALSSEDRADLAERLQANGRAVLSVLGDLLDLARLDADKIVLTPESVSIYDLVREVLASFEIETGGKQLDVRVEIDGDAAARIRIDRHRLRQILVNLLANAVKFTDVGCITVTAHAVDAEAGRRLVVDVSDTGIGIPAERHAFIFEPFEQVDSSIARRFGGTGLGLALSRRLAEQLGGSLSLLRSEPGSGSTFRLTLPAVAATDERGADATARTQDLAATILPGLRILLADDHPDVHRALRRLLEHAGASVESASDGREAVEKARSTRFDVVLMDLRMPDIDGIRAVRLLRGDGSDVPIVAMSADPAIRRRTEALRSGCDACIFKPFALPELTDAIREVIERRSAAAQA